MSFVWSESDLLWRQWCTLRQERRRRRRRRRRRKMKIVHLQKDEEHEDRWGGAPGVRVSKNEEQDKIGKDVWGRGVSPGQLKGRGRPRLRIWMNRRSFCELGLWLGGEREPAAEQTIPQLSWSSSPPLPLLIFFSSFSSFGSMSYRFWFGAAAFLEMDLYVGGGPGKLYRASV